MLPTDLEIIVGTPVFYLTCVYVLVIGACIGSFLNVVIWRVPLEESIVTAPSHCPKCSHKIRWFENIPIVSWLMLRGKCSACRAPISARYPIVEALTALLFLAAWMHGWYRQTPPAQIFMWLVIISLLVAITYIDLDHMIIPDGLNLTGLVAAFGFAVIWPSTHDILWAPGSVDELQHRPLLYIFVEIIARYWDGFVGSARAIAVLDAMIGVALGGGILWLLVEIGKLFFGRRRMRTDEPVVMSLTDKGFETEEHEFELWEDVFMREKDRLVITGELVEITMRDPHIEPFPQGAEEGGETTITVDEYVIAMGGETVPLEQVERCTVRTATWVEPREVMGFGDVKLMAMLGAFLGPGAVLFILAVSSLVGTVAGLLLMLFSGTKLYSKIPYGPYIAIAALIFIFFGDDLFRAYQTLLRASLAG